MNKYTKPNNAISEIDDKLHHIHQQMHFLEISTTTSDNDKKTLNEYYANKLIELENERDQRIKAIEVVEPILVSSKKSYSENIGNRILQVNRN